MADITRRRLIGLGTATTASAVAGSVMASAAKAAEQQDWDYETEILVCGFGGSGAITAIRAHDQGADVLIIEKQQQDTEDKINQTNSTRLAYSALMNFNNHQDAVDYLKAVSRGATPDDVIEGWADYAASVVDYLHELGVTDEQLVGGSSLSEYPLDLLPEGDNYTIWAFAGQGLQFWELIQGWIDEREIPVLYETPLKSLITDETDRVIGAVASDAQGAEVRIRATKAVVLSTGGFEHNDDMLNQYIWAYPTRFYANPGNTGDGIIAAQNVGAALWHMTLAGGRLVPYFEDLGYAVQGGTPDPYLIVNKYGKRFMHEDWKSHTALWEAFRYNTDLMDFEDIPAFSIFDQTAVDAGPVVANGMLSVKAYEWSEDNSVEIEKGWVLKADTLEELGALIASDPEVGDRMDPTVLAQTVATYNGYCEAGEDADFGRDPDDLSPVLTPPYYAIKLYPGGVNTFGGPRRNGKGQILRADGSVIGGLYGTGEMGSILGFLYSSGGWNISEVICSGRIAADNAVQEG